MQLTVSRLRKRDGAKNQDECSTKEEMRSHNSQPVRHYQLLKHSYWAPPSPGGPERFQPFSNAAAPPAFGDVRIGSTPLNSVMAVTSEPPAPVVETIMTASSFCKSERLIA